MWFLCKKNRVSFWVGGLLAGDARVRPIIVGWFWNLWNSSGARILLLCHKCIGGCFGAHMGPYGPIWAHVGPYGSSWTGLGKSVNFPSTFRRDIWTHFARCGSKTKILMKFLNDSASFLLEKLKNQIIFAKNPNIWSKIQKIPETSMKIDGNS